MLSQAEEVSYITIPRIYLCIYLRSLEFRSCLRQRAVSRLRARCARQDYKVATLGMISR